MEIVMAARRERSVRLNADIRQGLAHTSEVYADTAREWRSVDAEGWPAE